jgi:protein-tyrosine phosphatase
VERVLLQDSALRVDWIAHEKLGEKKVGLTLLPGRKDLGRDLQRDLGALKDQGVQRVLCLTPLGELSRYGVEDLIPIYEAAGFAVRHIPMVDQKAASMNAVRDAVQFIGAGLDADERVLIHCVGGLGRSGMVAACHLKTLGVASDDAIEAVRSSRSRRAIETAVQEELVREFTP